MVCNVNSHELEFLLLFFFFLSSVKFISVSLKRCKQNMQQKKKVYAAKWQKKNRFQRDLTKQTYDFNDMSRLLWFVIFSRKSFLLLPLFFAAATVIFAPFLREEALSFLHLVVVNKKYLLRDFYYFEMSYDTRGFCTHLGVKKKDLAGCKSRKYMGL